MVPFFYVGLQDSNAVRGRHNVPATLDFLGSREGALSDDLRGDNKGNLFPCLEGGD